MKDNNTIIESALPLVKDLPNTYNKVLGLYSARAAQPLGLVDCGIYALAISEYIKHKKIGIEEYLKNNSANWHPHTYLYVLYSFLDIAMTLKLNNIPVLAALADVAYEMARLKDITPDIVFMKHYMDGALVTDAIDTERMKEKHKTEWFRLCLLALASFKKAQRIAILEDLDITFTNEYNNGIWTRQESGIWLFMNGVWSEIIKTITKEEAEKMLNAKIV